MWKEASWPNVLKPLTDDTTVSIYQVILSSDISAERPPIPLFGKIRISLLISFRRHAAVNNIIQRRWPGQETGNEDPLVILVRRREAFTAKHVNLRPTSDAWQLISNAMFHFVFIKVCNIFQSSVIFLWNSPIEQEKMANIEDVYLM